MYTVSAEHSCGYEKVLENDAPSQATVYRWTADLQHSQQTTKDEPPSSRPSDFTLKKMLLLSRTRYGKIEDILGYSKVAHAGCQEC